jgi:hypothetical protein
MTEQTPSQSAKALYRSIIGVILLIGGVTCILMWWSAVMICLKALLGLGLAIGGLLVLYSIRV